MNISVEKVEYSLRAIYETSVVSDISCNDDGEEISLLDTVVSDDDVCGEIISAESSKELLDQVESVFCELQERQKPVVSAMMTIRICKIICDNAISIEGYSFIDREIITDYIRKNYIPTQRDIAARFGKNEASISRTVREFVEKLRGDK